MFDELKEKLIGILTSRLTVFSVIFCLLGGILIWRCFNLQIVHGEEYLEDFTLEIEKTRDILSTRGNIYDRNGNVLAYNELAYSVKIEDVLVIGFFSGLLTDVFFGSFLGFYALVLMYIGYLNGKFSRTFYPEDIKLPLALIVVSDLSYGMLCYVLTFMLRGRLQFTYYFTRIILPEALYTIVVTLFLYPLILKVNEKLESREKRRAQKFV